VRVTLLPSSVSCGIQHSNLHLTTYIVNERLAIDAGSLGLWDPVEQQAKIRNVLISHSHLDHLASLPLFVDNVCTSTGDPVAVHGSAAVLESLRCDVFNWRLWPDFIGMTPEIGAFLKLAPPLQSGVAVEIDGLRITPVDVNHTIPTHGFIIEDESSAIVIVSDSGPTDRIWELANRTPNLQAVFIETSFPNEMADIAELSRHLTPMTLAGELAKLKQPARIIGMHIKPRFRGQVEQELFALQLPHFEIVRPGEVYEF
jgi:ribonuclease BN (tRNA processing enzyme)